MHGPGSSGPRSGRGRGRCLIHGPGVATRYMICGRFRSRVESIEVFRSNEGIWQIRKFKNLHFR